MKIKSMIQFVLQRFNLSLLIFLFLILLATIPGFAKDPSAQKTVRVAVKTNVLLTQDIVDELAQYGKVNHVLWKVDMVDMQVTESNLASLAAHPQVQYVERDRVMENVTQGVSSDDLLGGISFWNQDMVNVTDSNPISADKCAQNAPPTSSDPPNAPVSPRCVSETGAGVNVAVLDTGLCVKWPNYFDALSIDAIHARSFITPSASNSPSSGGQALPEELGWDKASCTFDANPGGDNIGMHGTAVTSIILGYHEIDPRSPAQNLNFNGMAPKVKVIPIRIITNQDKQSTIDTLNAINYLIEVADELPGPLVANNSWAFGEKSTALTEAINDAIEANVFVVGGPGNCGPYQTFTPCPPDGGMLFPWGDPDISPKVINVGAVGWKQNGNPALLPFWTVADVPESVDEAYIAAFSARANPDQELDIMAPGNYVPAPAYIFQGLGIDAVGINTSVGGVSFAVPHGAGAAALLLEKNPNLTPCEMECLLKETTVPIPPGNGDFDPGAPDAPWGVLGDELLDEQEQGSGLLQVDKALEALDGGSVMNDCQQQCLSPEEEL